MSAAGTGGGRRALRLLKNAVLTIGVVLMLASLGSKLLRACAPDPVPAPDDAPVLLVGAHVFAGGERAAERLAHMVEATGVLGESTVRMVHAEAGSPWSLARALEEAGPGRAALVIVGDLSLFEGIDPTQPFPPQKQLTSRVVNWEAFEFSLMLFNSWARRHDATVVLCTPPLGKQGRVEVPELLEVGQHLRKGARVLDLTARFAELEPGPLFSNGIDQLDEAGHDALADVIYRALLTDKPPVPPRTPMERRARALMTALHQWAEGDEEALARAAEQGLERPAADARVSTLAAALATARTGQTPETAKLWNRIGEPDEAIPGLAIGRGLAWLSLPQAAGFEAELLQVLETLEHDGELARQQAQALARAHPERVEAWMMLLTAEQVATGARPSLSLAKTRQGMFDTGPVGEARARELLSQGASAMHTLPALLAVSTPYEGALATGPVLRAAQRKARSGMPAAALGMIDKALSAGPCPEAWSAAREAIAATR